MSDFYIVQKGDTLAKIAKQHGATVSELTKLNELSNPNKLQIGQKIALRKEVVCGFDTLFLDVDRNPINNLEYILEYCGKSINGTTSENGKAKKINTDLPTDRVRILVKRFDGTFKEVTSVLSGYRNKLVTLISPLLVIDTELKPHPALKHGERPNPKEPVKPVYGKNNPTTPTIDKKDLGLKVKKNISLDGKPITVAEGDSPDLNEFLDEYIGGDLTSEDILAAAKELECEPGLIFAIAKQESSSSSFFKLGMRVVPKILYERHQFRNFTRTNKKSASPYEDKYPDICGRPYYRAKKNKKAEWINLKSGLTVEDNDVYGAGGASQYKRLCKAYQLDPLAALASCSWGKFQIMGFNYKAAGFSSVHSFTKAMSRSEAEHIKAFLKFAKSNKVLLQGLQNQDFEKIAEGHNGENWRSINPEYASNIREFYKQYNLKK